MITLKKIIISIFSVMLISFFAYNLWLWQEGKDDFYNKSYNGIINEIRIIEGSRGLPKVKIDNKWRYIDVYESKIVIYIQVEDSIVKKSETETIIIYRKNKNDEWVKRVFD